MNVRFMQWVDFWIGVPICLLLDVVNRVLRVLLPSKPTVPKKVLFVELSEMGSAVLAYSAIQRLKALFADAEPRFLIFDSNKESVSRLRLIPEEQIILISDRNFISFCFSTFRALLRIRRDGVDTTVDLELFSRFTAILSLLSGASNRVGFHNYTAEGLYRGDFLTHKVLYNPHRHMSENFLALVESLNLNDSPQTKADVSRFVVIPPRRKPSTETTESVWRILREQLPEISPDCQLVLFNADPGEALPIRGWPAERFAELAKRVLAHSSNTAVAFVGLERALQLNAELMRGLDPARSLNLAGKTANLLQLVDIFGVARAFVTNDSGPAHFASLTALETFVLFGPETPELYRPLGDNIHVFYANYACSPCLSAANHRRVFCGDNKCLQAIAVDAVWGQLKKNIDCS